MKKIVLFLITIHTFLISAISDYDGEYTGTATHSNQSYQSSSWCGESISNWTMTAKNGNIIGRSSDPEEPTFSGLVILDDGLIRGTGSDGTAWNGQIYNNGSISGTYNWGNGQCIGSFSGNKTNNIQNQSPTANAGSNKTIIEGQSITLSGVNSYDKDGSIVSYIWSGNNLYNSNKSFNISDLNVGTHIFTLKVTDNDGGTDTDTVKITVEEFYAKPSKEDVAKLYVATFNRAPDSNGLNYWINKSELTLQEIAKSFFVQTETLIKYPEGTSNRTFIRSVYKNLFNREPDYDGLNYWENELNNGIYSRDKFILVVMNGAQDNEDGLDKTILNNKNEVGLYFADAGLGINDFPTEVIACVTSSYATVNSLKTKISKRHMSSKMCEDKSIVHNGLTYGTVVSPITGKKWLDRSIGALKVCESSNDYECFGSYFQWGRNADGHEFYNSSTTNQKASNVFNVGHDNFIYDNSEYYSGIDWANNSSASSYQQRETQWAKTDGTSVCPVGYRVPTKDEFSAETTNYKGIENLSTGAIKVVDFSSAFKNFLKLPASGWKQRENGEIFVNEAVAHFWTNSSFKNIAAYSINYSILGSSAGSSASTVMSGAPIRCIEGNENSQIVEEDKNINEEDEDNKNSNESITHNGIGYGILTSPVTGKVWLDRNLGAKQVCTSSLDKECYGDYFQWGRDSDGHEKSNSNTTSTRTSSINVSNSNFIKGWSDWTSEDRDGQKRSSTWNPCPSGYKVPTITELKDENIENKNDAYTNLKLPAAGTREAFKASLQDQNNVGYIWSSSVSYGSTFVARNIWFSESRSYSDEDPRGNAFSVRCIKD